jgi:hypothetical protein
MRLAEVTGAGPPRRSTRGLRCHPVATYAAVPMGEIRGQVRIIHVLRVASSLGVIVGLMCRMCSGGTTRQSRRPHDGHSTFAPAASSAFTNVCQLHV